MQDPWHVEYGFHKLKINYEASDSSSAAVATLAWRSRRIYRR